MTLIKNPIISGMAPDPSIIRVNNDYYLATSTFHWKPAIQIFHSTDLCNWNLITYALTNNKIDLRGTNTPAGIWAPHLSFDTQTQKFWLVYSHMQNMAGREFNAESFAIWANDIKGPWSQPLYLTSIGFDPSLFHDDDGKHYLSILEWETRSGYPSPGNIVIAEVNLKTGQLIGTWKRVTTGFTSRGCVEAPQIYKHHGFYYLLVAAGGTGYAHDVEIGRSQKILGPYEPNPSGEPIITSSPHHLFSKGDPDAGHFEMYNPHTDIQKSGHGSLVQTTTGEYYIAHLMSRPLPQTKLNPLGRETSLQKMIWTNNNWLQMADGSNLAKSQVEISQAVKQNKTDNINDDFKKNHYDLRFMTPYREQNPSWVNTTEHPGFLRIYGGNSLFSKYNPTIMATRATAFEYQIQTKVLFNPVHYSQSAGVGLYYDSDNWLYARICQTDNEKQTCLQVIQAKLGQRIDNIFDQVLIPHNKAEIRIKYYFGIATVFYRLSKEKVWQQLGSEFDVKYLSDEGVNGTPGEIGGFTGLFNFIGAVDAYQKQSFADFDYYSVINQVSGGNK
ncbi:glycoside hydrolase family 43 protein [Bombilactobacillus bombi]|uniref:family 43 glycosylhydrolase n=1 Tax=Bombilactobacillus bombi TaxID=1303590 RepID=UPI000E56BC32|nr:family 43 glycosylhydrolase [Bombilactobacillus bombi]AXX65024.1 glycoside hydrolase family 43 protein [Bombilactobacillus bombi]